MYARLLEESLAAKAAAPGAAKLTYDDVLGMPDGLDAMYAENFARAFPGGAEDAGWARSKQLIALVVAAREPLPADLAARVLGWSAADADRARADTALLFPVREGRFHVLHKSVVDWLTSGRAGGFAVGPDDRAAAHAALSGTLVALLEPLAAGAAAEAPAAMRAYALRHAVAHATRAASPTALRDLERVLGLRFVEATASAGRCAALVADLADAAGAGLGEYRRFVLQFSHVLAHAPSAVYSLAAAWPDDTAPRRAFAELLAQRAPETAHVMEQRIGKSQVLDPCLLTLEGHTAAVTCCAFSGDGTRIVTAS